MTLSLKDLLQIGLISELAHCFDHQLIVLNLLSEIGIGPRQLRDFTPEDRETWWRYVCEKLDAGLVVDGLSKLLCAAKKNYPGNLFFVQLCQRMPPTRKDVKANPEEDHTIRISFPEGLPDHIVMAIQQRARELLKQNAKVLYTNSIPVSPPNQQTPPVKKADPPKNLRWLHVSDLHFGHGAQARKRVDQKIVCREILTDAAIMTQRLGPPDMVFVTGDVAFSAAEKEYAEASQWLGQLLERVGVKKERLFMVPGNHDMDRGLAMKSPTSRVIHQELRKKPGTVDDYLEQPEEFFPLWPKMDAFFKFAQDYGAQIPPRERPFWTVDMALPMGSVVVAGLNTSLLSFDDGDAPTNLCLGAHQLHKAIQLQSREHLLLVVQHHPPDWLTDGEQMNSFLQDRPHLLFCGHVHRAGGLTTHPIGQQNRGTIRMVAGAGHAEGDNNHEHAYAWGSLSKEGLRYYPRTWVNKFSTFRADRTNFPEMDEKEAIFSPLDILPDPLKKWLKSSS